MTIFNLAFSCFLLAGMAVYFSLGAQSVVDAERQQREEIEKALADPLLQTHPELVALVALLELRQQGKERDTRVVRWWRNRVFWLLSTLLAAFIGYLLGHLLP